VVVTEQLENLPLASLQAARSSKLMEPASNLLVVPASLRSLAVRVSLNSFVAVSG
jgi:hypothetical protein